MAKILIVEDEEAIAQTLQRHLEEKLERVKVFIANDGVNGLELARKLHPDLIILDLGLPRLHGIAFLRVIRQELPETRICILSGQQTVEQRISGFEEGADEYVGKPFHLQELEWRIKSLLKRGKVFNQNYLIFDDLSLHIPTKTVSRGALAVRLPQREFELLHYLMQRPDQVVSRNELLSYVWEDKDCFPNTVDVHIENLRKKIDKPFTHHFIQTAYREGYYFNTHS